MAISFKFTELGDAVGDDLVEDLLGGFRGPLADVSRPKHGTGNYLSYPLDVEGLGERHFISFSILEKSPIVLNNSELRSSGLPGEEADESTTGQFLGGVIGALVEDEVGGGVFGGLIGGATAATSTAFLDETGLSGVADTGIKSAVDLAGDITGGAVELAGAALEGAADLAFGALDLVTSGIKGALPPDAAESFGRITGSTSELRAAIEKKVPLSKDGLLDLLRADGENGDVEGGVITNKGQIIMYVPVGIQETLQNSWTGAEMGAMKTLEKAVDIITGEGDVAEKVEAIASEAMNVGTELIGKVAGQKMAIPGMEGYLLKRGLGGAIGIEGAEQKNLAKNPHFEILYDKPSQRTFSFDFKMVPRNVSEAHAIQQIVRTFKAYSSPSLTGKEQGKFGPYSRFYTYPALFQIEYWNADKLHKLLPCALTNITVNYSGSGTPGTYRDGSPIQTDMTLTFAEERLISREDVFAGY